MKYLRGFYLAPDGANGGGDPPAEPSDGAGGDSSGDPGARQPLPPEQIMPDASPDELRRAIRELRDENKTTRLNFEQLQDKFQSFEGTAEERLQQLADALKSQQESATRARFQALAAQEGISPSVADLLDIGRFDLDNPDKAREQLRALNLTKSEPLPSAGTPTKPKSPDESGFKVQDLANLSAEEWDAKLADILKTQRDTPYTGG